MATNTLTLHIGQDADIPSWLNLDLDGSGNLVYSVEEGDQITLPNYNMVIKEGFVLGGWSETQENYQVGTSIVFTNFYEPTSNSRDLYPVWVEKPVNMRKLNVTSKLDKVTKISTIGELTGAERTAAEQAITAFGSIVKDKVLEMPLINTMTEGIEDLEEFKGITISSVSDLTASVNTATNRINGIDEKVNKIVSVSTETNKLTSTCTFVLGTVDTECSVDIISTDPNFQKYKYIVRLEDYIKLSTDYKTKLGIDSPLSGYQISWYNNGSIVSSTTPVPNNSVLYGNAITISTLSYYALPVIISDEYTVSVGTEGADVATDYGSTKVFTMSTSGFDNNVFDSKKSYNPSISQPPENFGEKVLLTAEPKDGCKFLGWYQINDEGKIYENGVAEGKIASSAVSTDKAYETLIDDEVVRYGALFKGKPEYIICNPIVFSNSDAVGQLLKYDSSSEGGSAVDVFANDFKSSSIGKDDFSNLGACTEYDKGELSETNCMLLFVKADKKVSFYSVDDPSSQEPIDVDDAICYINYDDLIAKLVDLNLKDSFNELVANLGYQTYSPDFNMYLFNGTLLNLDFGSMSHTVINISVNE